MSRFRRALHGVASSYVLLAAIALYQLASVPVALHYLDKERFGLWGVMGTLAGYLSLIDAGMTSAAARLLIDHKDDRNGGNYGSLIKTGWLVSILQGTVIFLIGLGLAGLFAQLMAIKPTLLSPTLTTEFIQLTRWQCGVVALSFSGRMMGLVLGAHQRMDMVNYIGVAGMLVNFIGQWIFFHFGWGMMSLVLAGMLATVVVLSLQAWACLRLHLLPQVGGWGRVSWQHFKELFNYGKDVFLVAMGTQMINASQVMVITRILGAEVAADWSVGLRVFNLLNQFIGRLSDNVGAGFAEMLTRGELIRLRDRYRNLAMMTFSLAGWAAVSFALCNSLFISLWTHGKIHWPVTNDWLLAVWLVLCAVVKSHNSFVGMTKKFAAMRYVYFLEGSLFVGLSMLVARAGGPPAILGCSIGCALIFSASYGIWRISRFFQVPFGEVALGWLAPMVKTLLGYLPLAGLVWWLAYPAPAWVRLGIHGLLAASVGAYFFLRFGINRSFQQELLGRVPKGVAPWLQRIFPQTVG